MQKSRVFLYSLLIGVLLFMAACSPHRQLGFQAMLTDPSGLPVPDGDYDITVRIWNSATESSGTGVVKILEDSQTVTVTDGFMNIAIPAVLDDAHELNPAQFARPLWAEFEIEGEILTPRQKLLATPLAFSLVGGAAVAINETTAPPLINNWPSQGAFNVLNAYVGDGPELKGSTGLVVSIQATEPVAEVIRACAGGAALGCANDFLVFRVFGDGDVTAKGAFTGGPSGYAELMQLRSGFNAEPGDVLMISGMENRQVVPAIFDNETRVAGVYVADPGFIAGGALEGQPRVIPVAFSGIVPVKVTDANGAIALGDLLTTSSAGAPDEGLAMKSTDLQVGTILGKAMEPHDSGTGVIDVLLTLQ